MPSVPFKSPAHRDLLLNLAEEVGTPTYVYDEAVLRRQCSRLRSMFKGIPAKLLYAVKANFNPVLLRILQEEGFGFDVVSPGEAELVLRLGTSPSDVLYSANNMSNAEMHKAAEQGVLLNIGERSRLKRFGQQYPGRDVCIRLNPNVGAGHHEHVITAGEEAKFGIPVDAIDDVHQIVERYNLHIIGLHQHIGSGILDVDTLWKAMQVLLEAADEFPSVDFINFGGGLGIPYHPEEKALGVDKVRDTIIEPLRAYAESRSNPITYWFEPGRYLVAESGVLLTSVTTLKPTETRTFVGTDSGFNHLLRPALYDAYHNIYNLSNPEGKVQTYDVTGNVCESGDLFARDRHVQQVREGDVLAVQDAGAYGMAMASYYNLRALPAEVLISTDGSMRMLRRRLTSEEMLTHLGLLENSEIAL